MNYRHGFHAGNFADVFKHAVLAFWLQSLRHKDKGFCYQDIYAGAGRYDLRGGEARRGGEYLDGIAKLWPQTPKTAAELAPLCEVLRALNPGPALRWYPGSPRIAEHFLRPQDRMVLVESQGEAYRALARQYRDQPKTQVREEDAWQALKALLPPLERRGLVLIDPPFERPDEFAQLRAGLEMALQRWPSGGYAIWYPLKDRPPVARFYREIKALGAEKILCAEFSSAPNPQRLDACGMLMINPPWTLPEQLARLLPWLARSLGSSTSGPNPDSSWRLTWL
jgi:23S rRNA (adenine2030-N6)-methyltransferase